MTFSHIVSAFFSSYLASERGLPVNTIASYSDVMKLLLNFACERFGVKPEMLRLEQLDRDLIVDFLDHLESDRGNTVSTRNQRLAAIKTFFHFLARNVPELMHLNATVQAIRQKETHRQPPPSLTVAEVNAILAVPDVGKSLGARDKVLLQLLYNTGARVQELADLNVTDVRSDACATVTLTGKGRKTRVIPLWSQTLEAINHYLTMRQRTGVKSDHLFLNVKARPMTRFGIGRRVEKLTREAAGACPSLRDRTVPVHPCATAPSPPTCSAIPPHCTSSRPAMTSPWSRTGSDTPTSEPPAPTSKSASSENVTPWRNSPRHPAANRPNNLSGSSPS